MLLVGLLPQLAGSCGRWICGKKSWELLAARDDGDDFHNVPKNVAFLAHGDSTAHNIYTGIQLLRTNFTLKSWQHDRNAVQLEGDPNVKHVCCGLCACGKPIEQSIRDVIAFIKRQPPPYRYTLWSSISGVWLHTSTSTGTAVGRLMCRASNRA